ncbi:hypothetical protein D3C84_894110 [compost metagenome]
MRISENLEPRIGQRIRRDHVTRLQQCHDGGGQTMLRPTHDQYLIGFDRQPTACEVARYAGSLMLTSCMGLVAQQRFQVA